MESRGNRKPRSVPLLTLRWPKLAVSTRIIKRGREIKFCHMPEGSNQRSVSLTGHYKWKCINPEKVVCTDLCGFFPLSFPSPLLSLSPLSLKEVCGPEYSSVISPNLKNSSVCPVLQKLNSPRSYYNRPSTEGDQNTAESQSCNLPTLIKHQSRLKRFYF